LSARCRPYAEAFGGTAAARGRASSFCRAPLLHHGHASFLAGWCRATVRLRCAGGPAPRRPCGPFAVNTSQASFRKKRRRPPLRALAQCGLVERSCQSFRGVRHGRQMFFRMSSTLFSRWPCSFPGVFPSSPRSFGDFDTHRRGPVTFPARRKRNLGLLMSAAWFAVSLVFRQCIPMRE